MKFVSVVTHGLGKQYASAQKIRAKIRLQKHFARILMGPTMKYVNGSVSSLSIDQFHVFDIVIKCNIAPSHHRSKFIHAIALACERRPKGS